MNPYSGFLIVIYNILTGNWIIAVNNKKAFVFQHLTEMRAGNPMTLSWNLIRSLHHSNYSFLRAFTGFWLATRHVWELTVSNATIKAIRGPAKNAQKGIGVWK